MPVSATVAAISAATANLMHPSDIILEQSNDDCSYLLDKRPRPPRKRQSLDSLGCSNDNENENENEENNTSSLIEEDYIIVDPITENYRAKMKQKKREEEFSINRSKSDFQPSGNEDSVNNH